MRRRICSLTFFAFADSSCAGCWSGESNEDSGVSMPSEEPSERDRRLDWGIVCYMQIIEKNNVIWISFPEKKRL